MTFMMRQPSPHDPVACFRGGCRIDHRGDPRYAEARRAFLLEKARARKAQLA